ncbi:hypothetical protein BJY52DRAFT_1185743 [Lactarius psammicola]|nr:hypothetical protein BJY52DRAFT_1185743 [Lactarius psammicola]
MDSLESPPSGGPRLLSESPQFSFTSVTPSSHTGPGGDDLSLSELYPNNRLPRRPAQARNDPKTRPSIAQALGFGAPIVRSQDASTSDVTVRAGEDVDPTHLTTQSREEKLRNDLVVLRQLNGAFAAYNDALRETQAGTERIVEQLEQTDALLNRYINILSKSGRVTQLIFDERWTGAEADEAFLEEEIRAQEEKRRREEEERMLSAQREQERKEKEELERAMRDEAERLERERGDKMASRSTSGVRGVRGTRASMRAGAMARGVLRVGASSRERHRTQLTS